MQQVLLAHGQGLTSLLTFSSIHGNLGAVLHGHGQHSDFPILYQDGAMTGFLEELQNNRLPYFKLFDWLMSIHGMVPNMLLCSALANHQRKKRG